MIFPFSIKLFPGEPVGCFHDGIDFFGMEFKPHKAERFLPVDACVVTSLVQNIFYFV
ncbi:hypothetical protein ES705_40282 [subsurface metagenome]